MALNSVQDKPSDAPARDSAPRPPIWVEGRQRPRFDPVAFGHAALAIAKDDLIPEITDAALRLDQLGQRVQRGDLRITAVWAQRVLPPHQWVARRILALGQTFIATRGLIDPPSTVETIAYPHLVPDPIAARPAPMPRPERPIRPQITQTEPTLHAIRSAIATPAHGVAGEPRPDSGPSQPKPPAAAAGWAQVAASWVLLAVLILFALPAGAIKALIHHLDGRDLRDLTHTAGPVSRP